MSFTHLHVHSNFSFLDGGSSVYALLDRAKEVGCEALALTDHNGLYGAVRFYGYAKKIGIKPIIGVEMDMEDTYHLVLLAKNINGYSNLCKIVTRAHLSHERGQPAASLELIEKYKGGLFCLSGCSIGEVPSLVAEGRLEAARVAALKYIDVFGRDNFLIEMQNHMLPGSSLINSQLNELASELGLRCVATNNVHYAAKEDFKVQDVLVCVKTLTRLDDDHPLRRRNAEYYLKSPKAMANLFRKYAKAVAGTDWIARQCNLDLNLETYRFPEFPVPEGETPYSHLCKLCFEALERLYRPITPEVTERLQHELKIINDLGFSEYFMVVWDIVRYAKSRKIRCAGRGSAADSLVAYCLGITIVDPIEHHLLFERFLNPERKGMPDIDIDFDSVRREEVINYIYERYGEDKVAMVCTVSSLKACSSIREIGKAMDFPPDDISRFASILPLVSANRIRDAVEKYPELRDSGLHVNRLDALIDICEKVDNYPRHLSVHLGGVLIGRGVLTDLVPLERSANGVIVSQFDKDDVETLGLVKMDLLSLRNLSAIEDCLALIRQHHGIELYIDNVPLDDAPTYQLLQSANTVGLFQVESPGMRGILGRLQPEVFNDLIAQVSLFRPGPLQADMINPFIARRRGLEEVSYPHPSLEAALKETYGVIIYQEQVIQISHALAGFSYGQADSLRRAMTTDRSQAEMEKIKDSFITSACRKGVSKDIAEEVFSRVRAFAAYGLCKGHSASFARTAYYTAYLKTHYPAEFLTGIFNNGPMGFYPPNVIMEEARHLGIRLLGVDINLSEKKFTVEYDDEGVPGIRVGFVQVKNISGAEIESILAARAQQAFSSFSDFCLRSHCDRPTVENLINCGAFDCFGIPRGKLLWLLGEVVSKKVISVDQNISGQVCLLDNLNTSDLDEQMRLLPDVPELTLHEQVRMDYEILGLSTRCHPLVFYREKLTKARIIRTSEVPELPNNTIVRLAGVVIVCMRPPTKSGALVVFLTLEDEDGLADCVVFKKTYDQYAKIIYNNPALIIEGKLEKAGRHGRTIIVRKIKPLTAQYQTDNAVEVKPFKERRRIAGARSFVRSGGV